MKFSALICLSLTLFAWPLAAAEPEYTALENWLKPAPGTESIGNSHGDVAVSSAGDVYVSVMGPVGGVAVFGPDGAYLQHVKNAPNDFHGFVIHKNAEGEFLYGARLSGQSILKMTLDGDVVFEIPGAAIPDEFKRMQNDKPILRLTGMDVASDGRLFVVDGYSSDYIHIFSAEGKYLDTFGGKAAPYNFKTCHKIAIDTRFEPARILCCDRENRRVVSLSLDGEVLGIVEGMKRPAAIAVFGDWAAVGEIEGRISLLDRDGKVVRTIGENDVKEQTATNQVKPADWRTGVLTAPHGVDFAANGDLLVSEYNIFGRVVRYQHTRE